MSTTTIVSTCFHPFNPPIPTRPPCRLGPANQSCKGSSLSSRLPTRNAELPASQPESSNIWTDPKAQIDHCPPQRKKKKKAAILPSPLARQLPNTSCRSPLTCGETRWHQVSPLDCRRLKARLLPPTTHPLPPALLTLARQTSRSTTTGLRTG